MDSPNIEATPPPALGDPGQRSARNATLSFPFQAANHGLEQVRTLLLTTSRRGLDMVLQKKWQISLQAMEEQLGNLYVAGIRWQRTAEALAEVLGTYGAALLREGEKPMLTLDYLFDPAKHPVIYKREAKPPEEKAAVKKRTKKH